MTIARDTTASNIKPLSGSIVRRHTSGDAVAAGEIVSLQDDGYVDPSNMGSGADEAIGIAVQAAAAAGEVIDVVVFGPVKCLTGATPGKTVFNSASAGEPTETDASNETAIGYAKSTTVLFVLPEHLV
ncbi:MAG: hypothetical protein ABIH03_14135 [Pseudomonadota bacterium]